MSYHCHGGRPGPRCGSDPRPCAWRVSSRSNAGTGTLALHDVRVRACADPPGPHAARPPFSYLLEGVVAKVTYRVTFLTTPSILRERRPRLLQLARELGAQPQHGLGVELADSRLGDSQHLADLAQGQVLVVVEGHDQL